MAKFNLLRMRGTKMQFKEVKRDEEGNIIRDKKTGEPVYMMVYRVVRYTTVLPTDQKVKKKKK